MELIPYCGVIPGLDALTEESPTVHDMDLPIEWVGFGLPAYVTYASPEALGDVTPLGLEDEN